MSADYSLEIEVLREMPLFKGISDNLITEILESSPHVIRFYKKGDFIAVEKGVCKSLLALYEGIVQGYMTSNEGKKIVVENIVAPMLAAPNFLFATKNFFPITAEVISESAKVVVINKDSFLDLMMKNKLLLTNYLNVLSDKSIFLFSKLNDSSLKSLSGRLAKYFYQHYNQIGTQQQIADLLGATRPSIGRIIKKFSDENYIEITNHKINIINRERLKELFG